MASKKPKKGVASLSKKDLREYNTLKKRVSRSKRKAKAEGKKFKYAQKRGKVSKAKTERSAAYKDLTANNRLLNEFKKEHNIGETNVSRFPGKKTIHKKNVQTQILGSWQFEPIFINNVNRKSYRKITFVNSGETFNGKKENPINLLQQFDIQRNLAYLGQLALTPWVSVSTNINTKDVTIEFIS